ncbi:pirin family protein [Tahibacter harae]|uniref:Pirin family protein n=1 Tax=Tahibacter harae TaxID=2963937 RepID=A0ABT1QVC9_9GAMM|nr:pirin family protein [Tahibacter harae]MCQ4166239.1 pirin family protein [Tahibacter harae]
MNDSVIRITPRIHDIGGGLIVRRALPHQLARSVGPFVFVDEFGPLQVAPGRGTDVRPHPHIGLATVTYLLAGRMVHRDSLGTVQEIRPGDINLMSAGRGIVHSERGTDEAHAQGQYLHGLQTWLALPQEQQESAPWFRHYPGAGLPRSQLPGARLQVLIGTAFGLESPVAAPAPTLYVLIELDAGASLVLDADYAERALYVIEGEIDVDDSVLARNELGVLTPASDRFTARSDSRVVLLGGAPLDGPRLLWWNFVASSRERIEQAKEDWAQQRFPSVPGETEFIPLPG